MIKCTRQEIFGYGSPAKNAGYRVQDFTVNVKIMPDWCDLLGPKKVLQKMHQVHILQ